MSAFTWVVGALATAIGLVVCKVLLDLVTRQVQGWLWDLPIHLLRFARKRSPTELRESLYDGEKLEAELQHILLIHDKKPLTGLWKGLRFAFGCAAAARRIHRAGLSRSHRSRWLTGVPSKLIMKAVIADIVYAFGVLGTLSPMGTGASTVNELSDNVDQAFKDIAQATPRTK